MNALACAIDSLPATPQNLVDKLTRVQDDFLKIDQLPIKTEHVLHAGMYVRTVTMPPCSWLIGALIKRATIVIAVGTGKVFLGHCWQPIAGYRVMPAQAGRKQLFVSDGPLIITMMFPTSAKTVEEAENEFTDEAALLLSRSQPELNDVIITGE